ncbi:type 2 isopentenyl-diphosphate Delta-isomerase [Rhodohalobacter halophilus]|uniref:type 2 isopentenyl-diphosphate Delta-isomerase n=1 Tax=Rhodohalobacter halophilus TaxID=1812810 RepID=UPI00083FCC6C|nr:type 2 isopentenyl-diphosphate Delta-isomerase [Rhodohalobacter halophilus]
MSIQERKKDHVDLTAYSDVFYRKTTGFEAYDFMHNALPEVNPAEVDVTASLLGRTFSLPLFISSMTGGYTEAGSVNSIIAKCCQENNLPFGVGSQRAMLEDERQIESFSVVREHAPDAFISANIGGAQLIGGLNSDKLNLLVNSIQADAIIVHLNPLQELMQPEGDHDFAGIEKGIEYLIANSPVPVMIKETGAGISGSVARRLLAMGADCIDVAGAGGTSWAKVENLRERQKNPMHQFDDWGIPTVECLNQIAPLKDEFRFDLIASGGIRSSFDVVKAIALGADFAATAQPVIHAIKEKGEEGVQELISNWSRDLKYILALLGCKSLNEVHSGLLRTV